VKKFEEIAIQSPPVDFLETLYFSKETLVVMKASFASLEEANASKGNINVISYWFKPWFYKHVEHILKSNLTQFE